MKINHKYRGITFSCLAAIFISVPMALIMVIINYGIRPGFLLAFLKSAVVGTAISIPLANLFIPIAEKIVQKIVAEPDEATK
ncbi:DUF2798 domain-containing protein [Serpentinicella sp. ANB-PHB4]|uniref:DUF2798 domain-containing protein n=1 Tax=Serpentinicella sp. ANB-PHB4 TaxID=3074076 RepID=UPI00285E9338|nr:DUF2798 domain-containing protein [Serpentinicella sp. ANB-PHB4]MDR5658391.1 DUF2798 domain-containing protein [Serpentinicella sp. ANB-PHB4]